MQLRQQTFVAVFCLWVLGGKRQPREVLHVLFGSYQTAKKLDWCQKKPQGLLPFIIFKKQFWSFQALWEAKFTKYTSLWGCVLIQAFILASDPRGYIPLPWAFLALCYHRSLFLLETHSQASTNLCDKGKGWGPFCRRQGQLLTLPWLPYDYKGQTTVLREKNKMYGLWNETRDGPSVAVAGFRGQACSKGMLFGHLSVCFLLVGFSLGSICRKLAATAVPSVPLRFLFLSWNFRSWYCYTLIWTGVRSVPLGKCSMLGCLRPQPKTCGLRGMEFPHSNIMQNNYYRKEAGKWRPEQVHHTQGHWTSSSRLIIWLQLLRREKQSSVGFLIPTRLESTAGADMVPASSWGGELKNSADQCSRLSMLGPNTGLHFSAWTLSSSLIDLI